MAIFSFLHRSHTEILRLATLWHYGGVYLDTDVIIMRPLKPDLHNCLGTELTGKYREAKVLNGAILIFEKGSRFVWEAMHEFNSTYRIVSILSKQSRGFFSSSLPSDTTLPDFGFVLVLLLFCVT